MFRSCCTASLPSILLQGKQLRCLDYTPHTRDVRNGPYVCYVLKSIQFRMHWPLNRRNSILCRQRLWNQRVYRLGWCFDRRDINPLMTKFWPPAKVEEVEVTLIKSSSQETVGQELELALVASIQKCLVLLHDFSTKVQTLRNYGYTHTHLSIYFSVSIVLSFI